MLCNVRHLAVHGLELLVVQMGFFFTDGHRACLRKLTIGFKMAGRR